MERTPIRVGQVREMPGGLRYIVVGPQLRTANDPAHAWLCQISRTHPNGGRLFGLTVASPGGLHRIKCGIEQRWWRAEDIYEPVVGWSREHLPPPVLTDNPAEVVEGEVRWDSEPYTVVGFSRLGQIAIKWMSADYASNYVHSAQGINTDRLISRPGVTL